MTKKIIGTIMLMISLFFLLSCDKTSFDYENEGVKGEMSKYVAIDYEEYFNLYPNLDPNLEHRFVSIAFNELMDKINSKGDYVLYIGGSWCPNCQAMSTFLNEVALNYEYKVYNFDTRIGSEKTKESDIRNCNNEAQEAMYRYMIESLDYKNPMNITSGETDIQRMSVPTIISIKKGVVKTILTREYFYDNETKVITDTNNEVVSKDDFINEIKKVFEDLK